ncbi:AI-2E family transporter [Opitutaceae bacterium EW11]|nr:AI-2E family transporter [Opitutaceae bacterium EW11]
MPEQAPAPLFSDGQRRLLAFTAGLFALVASGALVVFLLVLAGRVIGFFSHVLWPLAVAVILALILRPMVDAIEARLNGRRILSVIILYALFIGLVTTVLLIIIPPLASQILDFIAYVPELWSRGVAYAKEIYPHWIVMIEKLLSNPAVAGAAESVKEQAGKLPSFLLPSLRALKDSAWAAVAFFTHLAVIPIYLFFFLLSRADYTKGLPDHLPFLSSHIREDVVFLVREFISIVVTFFRGQLVIGLIMGGMYAAGFTVVGLRFGLFIGLLMGFLNIVPYLGTIIGLLITVPLALLQDGGGLKLLALVLLVKVIVQTIEGWVLTPKIMGDRTGLHPITIIVAVFFWGTALDGILGMVLAIPLTAFFVTAWRLLKRKYFPQPERRTISPAPVHTGLIT